MEKRFFFVKVQGQYKEKTVLFSILFSFRFYFSTIGRFAEAKLAKLKERAKKRKEDLKNSKTLTHKKGKKSKTSSEHKSKTSNEHKSKTSNEHISPHWLGALQKAIRKGYCNATQVLFKLPLTNQTIVQLTCLEQAQHLATV